MDVFEFLFLGILFLVAAAVALAIASVIIMVGLSVAGLSIAGLGAWAESTWRNAPEALRLPIRATAAYYRGALALALRPFGYYFDGVAKLLDRKYTTPFFRINGMIPGTLATALAFFHAAVVITAFYYGSWLLRLCISLTHPRQPRWSCGALACWGLYLHFWARLGSSS